MTSRERVRRAINHEIPDRVPLDLGSTSVTGIHAISYRNLKKIFGIEGEEIKIIDPFQMLAEVEEPVRKKLGIDTCGLQLPSPRTPKESETRRNVTYRLLQEKSIFENSLHIRQKLY